MQIKVEQCRNAAVAGMHVLDVLIEVDFSLSLCIAIMAASARLLPV